MNKKTLSIVGGLVVVGLIALLIFKPWSANDADRAVEMKTVTNQTYSLNFEYPAGVDGYELIESGSQDEFLHSYVLIDADVLASFQEAEFTDTPPTMSIFVFTLPEESESEGVESAGRITRLQNWAQENAGLTAYNLMYGTPDIVEIDGLKALSYLTDGLYQQEVFLASYRGHIYMFVGQYDRPTDAIKKDFERLIASITFE